MSKGYNLLSILSFIFAFVFFPAGLVLGIVALHQIKKTKERGEGLAIAAIVLAGLGFVMIILLAILWAAVAGIILQAVSSVPAP